MLSAARYQSLLPAETWPWPRKASTRVARARPAAATAERTALSTSARSTRPERSCAASRPGLSVQPPIAGSVSTACSPSAAASRPFSSFSAPSDWVAISSRCLGGG